MVVAGLGGHRRQGYRIGQRHRKRKDSSDWQKFVHAGPRGVTDHLVAAMIGG
jgi:hypothetical protein